MAKGITSKAQAAAQKLAWRIGRDGLKQSPMMTLVAAWDALAGHPDTVSRERIGAEITRREQALVALRSTLAPSNVT